MYIKGITFADIFNTEQKLKKKIINYHLINGSQKRVDKIKYIFSKILNYKININEKIINKKLNEFKKIYKKNSKDINLIDGVDYFIKCLFKNKSKIYIVSAAPKYEINYYLRKYRLHSCIKEIYDSKIDKLDAMKKILTNNNFQNEKCIYFGDSISDWDLCNKVKVDFCAVLTNKKSKLNKKKSFIKIYDFL